MRSVTVTRNWPAVTLDFHDTDAEAGEAVNWQHDLNEGKIVFDVSNNDFNKQINDAIKDATNMWVNQDVDFTVIFRKYPNAISNWSLTP